jgi:hypothetical protein
VSSANINIYQGDDYAAIVSLTDNDTGGPADLTGYTATAQIRDDYADNAQTVVATFVIQIQGSDVYLTLAHDVTALLKGNYRWDLQLVDSSGQYTTPIYGKIFVLQEVTRP